MLKNYTGLYTALITPFTKEGAIDYKGFTKLINLQLQAKVNGVVVLGTTGELSTIKNAEVKNIINTAARIINRKIKLIVGISSNNTETSIKQSKQAEDLGADALLVASPSYNKPPQEGLYQHFKSIADSIDVPMILYNIQSRTAINIDIKTLLKLSKHKNIIGIKEASSDISQIINIISKVDKNFIILSGNDVLAYTTMCLGGHGLISVASNVLPSQLNDIVKECLMGNFIIARREYYKLYYLLNALSSISINPIPVKTILAHLGIIKEEFRLPLCRLTYSNKIKLIKIYNNVT